MRLEDLEKGRHSRGRELKIGIGDWYVPHTDGDGKSGPSPLVQWVARSVFLSTLTRVAADAVYPLQTDTTALYGCLLELLRELPRSLGRGEDADTDKVIHDLMRAAEESLWDWDRLSSENPWVGHPHRQLREFGEFRACLCQTIVAWSQRYNLNYRWVWETIFHNLGNWHAAPGHHPTEWSIPVRGKGDSVASALRRIAPKGPAPEEMVRRKALFRELMVPFFLWDPRAETEAEVRERFEQYLGRCKELATSLGWLQVAVKRSRSGEPDLHFEWLVRFQVQNWTYGQIAGHYGLSEGSASWDRPGTVGSAVRAVAELVGIDLRQQSRGRSSKEEQFMPNSEKQTS